MKNSNCLEHIFLEFSGLDFFKHIRLYPDNTD